MQRAFIYDNHYIILEKDTNESIERFISRGNFMVRLKPNTDTEFKKMEKYSRIWANIKYDHCSYSQNIMNILKTLEN
jgi:hypothetical protein